MIIYQSLVATCATLVGLFASGKFFHDKIDGVKAISMVLAIWGFISYFYQHYLDDSESKAENRDVKEISMLPLLKEVTDEQDGLKNIYQKVPLSTENNFQNYEH
ncbi:hypothetical protein SO802_005859 [Lithocarpus litseifolius]|uniref:GDT1 family protein n=1 Tax=Lithocarpus litseifolius TaxID=425828 RepID=A0AAW2DK11_9ROSI